MGINHLETLDGTDPTFHYSAVTDRIVFVTSHATTVVRPAIDHLLTRFSDLYDPYQKVAVDEAIPWRSTLKQYMLLKAVKRGIKVWALADSHNGYFHKFQVYTGKEGSGEKHLGQRVVKDLTQHLKGKHHHVYFDNFFTSEQLLRDLAEDDIYACGTA